MAWGLVHSWNIASGRLQTWTHKLRSKLLCSWKIKGQTETNPFCTAGKSNRSWGANMYPFRRTYTCSYRHIHFSEVTVLLWFKKIFWSECRLFLHLSHSKCLLCPSSQIKYSSTDLVNVTEYFVCSMNFLQCILIGSQPNTDSRGGSPTRYRQGHTRSQPNHTPTVIHVKSCFEPKIIGDIFHLL